MNLTSCPKLAIEFGKTGLIPVFLGMTEALKDCIPDIIPFEDPETKTISKWTARGRTLSRLLGSLVNMAIQVSNRIVRELTSISSFKCNIRRIDLVSKLTDSKCENCLLCKT